MVQSRTTTAMGGHYQTHILARDDYGCRYCGYNDNPPSGKGLDIHHLINDKDNGPWNLLTLCDRCHTFWEAIRRMPLNNKRIKEYIRLIAHVFGYDDNTIHTIQDHICACNGYNNN